MKNVLITGATQGIGLETAKYLSGLGYFVYLGSRDLARGNAIVEQLLQEGYRNMQAILLDVKNQETLLAAKTIIENQHHQLDVLINNAAISGVNILPDGSYDKHTTSAILTAPNVYQTVFETNLYGVINVTQTFLPLLHQSSAPRIVMVSSTVGSLSLQTDPNWMGYDMAKLSAYSTSKAALNMYTVHLAYELKDSLIKVNMVDPGYTKTAFNGFNGGDPSIAAKRVAKLVLIKEDGPHSKFFSEETNPTSGVIAW